ncbi:hypothetical protein SKAU_G00420270 [Synaphobranchus kaupii]|uniref:Uncharacterized protein n=1 Tax=Synaphobranchus kaupii TaxID=118154 RepID=A0A9Q1E6J1_SYNKA|nr:hypothetical protein SKAU_G00420270 [Synaphobranchus kaupii]
MYHRAYYHGSSLENDESGTVASLCLGLLTALDGLQRASPSVPAKPETRSETSERRQTERNGQEDAAVPRTYIRWRCCFTACRRATPLPKRLGAAETETATAAASSSRRFTPH